MVILEICLPGTSVVDAAGAPDRAVSNAMMLAANTFVEANIALNCFSGLRRNGGSQEFWEQANFIFEERRRISMDRYRSRGGNFETDHFAEMAEVERQLRSEFFAAGRLPSGFSASGAFLHAKSFVSSIDSIEKLLGTVATGAGGNQSICETYNRFSLILPHLRGVRNSAQHVEDRSRSIGRGGRPMVLQPVENRAIVAPEGGALIIGMLNGSRLGYTMADGHYGEVDVSEATLENVRQIVQGMANNLTWSGPAMFFPTL